MNLDKEILVVIPYWAKGAQGNELMLAVNGWRKHFKEPHRIVIVGDRPDWLTGKRSLVDIYGNTIEWFVDPEWDYDIKMIDCPQVTPIPGQYLPHLDHVHKFRTVREAFPESRGFIYTCDDIYATADFTIGDVLRPKEPKQGFFFDLQPWQGKKPDWYTDKQKTGELCRREVLPVRNWICHLPVYYEWDKLLAVYDKYDCDHNSYVVENIYFNQEYPGNPHAVSERDYHDEVVTASPDIRPIGSVKWVSNANCGWSERLEEILRKHYGL